MATSRVTKKVEIFNPMTIILEVRANVIGEGWKDAEAPKAFPLSQFLLLRTFLYNRDVLVSLPEAPFSDRSS
jgi:hypothetical protein